MRHPERRKAAIRRRLADLLPIIRLYIRKKDPKEIAFLISQGKRRPVSAWRVRKTIRLIIRTF